MNVLQQKKVGIIMVNYKTYAKRFLKESYESIMKMHYPKNAYKIFIADNKTSQETQDEIRKIAPEAIVVPSDGNGWGHGNNIAIQKAIDMGYDDYFYIVNMDTIFDSESLLNAIRVMESDSNIGIVQSKILLHPSQNGIYKINSIGNALTFLGFGYCLAEGEDDYSNDRVKDITTASGVALLISKQVFLKGMRCDSSYFMYHDDIELSLKTRLQAKKIVIAPKSVVYHKHEFSRSIGLVEYMERNRIRLLLEFFSLKTLILIFPAFLIMEIGMIPYSIKNKWFHKKLKAYAYFFQPKNWFEIKRKRMLMFQLREITDAQLMHNFQATVESVYVENLLLKYIANPFLRLYWKVIKKFI